MHPVSALERLGGIASRGSLLRLTSKAELTASHRSGDVVRDSRGRYALPNVEASLRAANTLAGTVSHTSAAAFWGWELKTAPAAPHVTVPRKRQVAPDRRKGLQVHWLDLHPEDVSHPAVTSRDRTLTDCLTSLPFDEALALADSALRHEDISPSRLTSLVTRLNGPGSARARRVAAAADSRAANPFESVLRAIALDVRGLSLIPQRPISWPGFYARPDLVDEDLRLVLEADSHTWHSSRADLRRDCRRYNALVLNGWTVLRFTWEDVMFHPDAVQSDLTAFVGQAQRGSRRAGRD